MSVDVRVLTADEVEQAEAVFGHSFGLRDRHDFSERLDLVRARYDPDWYLGAFDGPELTSMMRIIPNAVPITDT